MVVATFQHLFGIRMHHSEATKPDPSFFFVVWVQHLVLENLETKDALELSAVPDFLGEVGILHATTHERADFNSRR
jgi:hypothetical protein